MGKRYIDADALQKEYQKEYGKRLLLIDVAPPADVVEVVRCKDCKNLSKDRIAPDWHRICRKYGVGKSDDGYCDDGERKETEDE